MKNALDLKTRGTELFHQVRLMDFFWQIAMDSFISDTQIQIFI